MMQSAYPADGPDSRRKKELVVSMARSMMADGAVFLDRDRLQVIRRAASQRLQPSAEVCSVCETIPSHS